jgi:hypothetical protein
LMFSMFIDWLMRRKTFRVSSGIATLTATVRVGRIAERSANSGRTMLS